MSKLLYPNAAYRYLTNDHDLAAALKTINLKQLKRFGLDCETTGLDPHRDRVRLVQIAIEHQPTWVIDLFDLSNRGRQWLQALLSSPACKIGHSLKFEWKMLYSEGLTLAGPFFDTHLAYAALTAGLNTSRSLSAVVHKLLGLTLDKREQTSDFSQPELTPKQLQYAANDAAVLLDLGPVLRRELQLQQPKTSQPKRRPAANLLTIARLESGCVPITAQMELKGFKLSLGRWRDYKHTLEAQRKDAFTELQQLTPPTAQQSLFPEIHAINPNSHQQLLAALQAIGVPAASTSQRDLIPWAKHFPVIQALFVWRRLEKLSGTFDVHLPKYLHPITRRLHPSWFQYGARSGRYSCKDPALQVIPRTLEARRCFIAEPGNVLIKADFSQIELRIIAKLSGDLRLQTAYQNGEDIHQLTVSLITGRPIEQVSVEERRLGKAINFGLVYGMGAAKLQSESLLKYDVSMTLEEAKAFIQRFFAAYPGIQRWHLSIKQQFNHNVNESWTLVGRRRLWAGKPKLNALINHPVQGLCADIIKLAGLKLNRALMDYPPISPDSLQYVWFVALAHDEIVLECQKAIAPAIANLLKHCMVSAGTQLLKPTPVEVDLHIGDSWAG